MSDREKKALEYGLQNRGAILWALSNKRRTKSKGKELEKQADWPAIFRYKLLYFFNKNRTTQKHDLDYVRRFHGTGKFFDEVKSSLTPEEFKKFEEDYNQKFSEARIYVNQLLKAAETFKFDGEEWIFQIDDGESKWFLKAEIVEESSKEK